MNFSNPKITTDWARIPASESAKENGRTHGIHVLKSGNILLFHQAYNPFVEYSPDGEVIRQFGGNMFMHAHGLTVTEENGSEILWVTDEKSGKTSKLDLDGNILSNFPKPNHPAIEGENSKPYLPTAIAPHPERDEVWTTDGYGSHYIYRFSKDGKYLGAFNEIKGAGTLKEPHGISFYLTPKETEVWISDRANQRLLVCDSDGNLLRKTEEVHTPCMVAFYKDFVAVTELFTGIKIFHRDSLELITEIGKNPNVNIGSDGVWDVPEGWPNLRGTDKLDPIYFNSPHHSAFAPDGTMYMVEWIIGGRINKIEFDT